MFYAPEGNNAYSSKVSSIPWLSTDVWLHQQHHPASYFDIETVS